MNFMDLKCLDALKLFENGFFVDTKSEGHAKINQKMQEYIEECLQGTDNYFSRKIREVVDIECASESSFQTLYKHDISSPSASTATNLLTFSKFCKTYKFIE